MEFPDLTGQSAVVTGAGSGIGSGVADLFARAGARVTVADRDPLGAQATVDRILEAGGDAQAVTTDVTDQASVENMMATHVQRYGGLNVVCNSAGVFVDATPAGVTREQLDRAMDVNFHGTVSVCQAALPSLRAAGGGSIINIATGGLDRPLPGQIAYLASKAAVTEYTRCLAMETGVDGIRVNGINAGYVDTAMIRRNDTDADGVLDEAAWAERAARYAAFSPLGKLGRPLDIAWCALYLATEMGAFVTGQVLRPNGGFVMPR